MKKTVLLFILILTCSLGFSQVNDVFAIQTSDYTIVRGNPYAVIESRKNSGFTSQIGAPQLPTFTRNYALPPGSTVTNISFSNGSTTKIGNSLYLYPVQPPCSLNGEPCPDFVAPDQAVYNSNTPFPAATATLTNDVVTFGYHIVTVTFCPFQYLPKDRKLLLYNQIDLTVNYSIGNVEYQMRITENRHKITQDYVRGMVQNPTAVSPAAKTANTIVSPSVETGKLQPYWKPSLYGDLPDYIIITSEALKSGFEPFVAYKTQRGIPTLLVTVEQIYAGYPGCDNAEKVRNYLKAAHQYWGAGLFVLLGGDTAVVPGRNGFNDGTHKNYTDLYYCDVYKPNDLNYNWNADGDAFFGEFVNLSNNPDGCEFGADNFIGRAPVDTPEEVGDFITKIINYEKLDGVAEKNYVNNMLFLGAYPDYNTPTTNPNVFTFNSEGQKWHRELADQAFLASPVLKKRLVFDDYQGSVHNIYPGDEELNRATVLDRLNNGYPGMGKFHLVSHYDHGSSYGLGVSTRMKYNSIYREDMDALTNANNGSYYQIMYSTACEDGNFANDCFAEHYVNSKTGGGVAMIANSVSVGYYNTQQGINLFKSIYGNLSPTSYIIGAAFASARDAYVGYNSKSLTLFAEPSMAVWSGTPAAITLTVPSTITIANDIASLPITINPLTEAATVTVYKYNTVTDAIEVYASEYLAAGATTANFVLHPDTAGALTVMATAKNYIPATATTAIALPQAHLYVTGYTFTDSNGNGYIEQGETISLKVKLTNSGNTAISSINTALSCSPAFAGFASITNNQASYPVINAGQTVLLGGFTFVAEIAADMPDFIELLLHITADGNYDHLDNFYLGLAKAVINPGTRTLATGATAVTNLADVSPNVPITLKLQLNNTGNIATGALTAVLASSLPDTIMQITATNSSYPDMAPFAASENSEPFIFKFLIPHTGAVPCTLTLTNALGQKWLLGFDLNEGLPQLISGFNFTSTKSEIRIRWNPVSNIKGYNIYHSDQENGTYIKINDFLVTGSAVFNDGNVSTAPVWYYKISVVTLSGNELPLEQVVTNDNPAKQGYKAWPSLDAHGGFPIGAEPVLTPNCESSPTLYDIDGDGRLEIFSNYYNTANEISGRIMGFKESGQELYNIDGNETTVSGFAVTDISMVPNAAVGDLDNDGHAEVVACGRNIGAYKGKLFVYKTTDADNNNQPDPFWNTESKDIGSPVFRNPVLYDIDNDGFLDIIVANEKQDVMVFDKNGNAMPGWPQQVPSANGFSEGQIAVADLDHDGKAEIALGVQSNNGTKGAIYIWNHDGTPFTVNPFREFADGERADGGIVFADMDNDNNLDVLITTKQNTVGKIYAFRQDGAPVAAAWNGTNTFICPNGLYEEHIMSRIAVGDLNHDGDLEVAYISRKFVHLLDKEGNLIFELPVLDNRRDNNVPAIADVDSDHAGQELIVNSGDFIYAYNYDGTLAPGFPIESQNGNFVGSPSVADLDNDGKNEIVATAGITTYVYKTDGDASKIEWGSYRANAHNTGTYREVCDSLLDLCVKDGIDDTGTEPNNSTQYMWTSDNIWVRNNNDTGLEHQNPEYSGENPSFIKVRVINKSCIASTGTEQLTVYWAKAATALAWPGNWDGSMTFNNPETGTDVPFGGEVGTLNIPVLQPGAEIIMSFPWMAPNPGNYTSINTEPWHFCLLSRIVAAADPMFSPETWDINANTRNNNNIAWKNLTIVNSIADAATDPGEKTGGVIAVGNPFDEPKIFRLEMVKEDLETGKPIYEEAEVGIKMDEILYRAWKRGGKTAQRIDNTQDEKKKIVNDNNVILDNILFEPNQRGTLYLSFNFLTKEMTEKTNYRYHVIQKEAQTGQVIGGETYVINKSARTPFRADAGQDKQVDLNQAITISAADINEPALYNWYDSDGNLIFQGKDLQIDHAVAEKYKLEVISTIDGFKDYSEVEVTLKPNRLVSIAPNPARESTKVSYKLNQADSAYIMIFSYYMNSAVANNYVLDVNSTDTTIDLTNYPTGFYTVALVANGQIVDAKIIFRQ